jgi:hypothetical protein
VTSDTQITSSSIRDYNKNKNRPNAEERYGEKLQSPYTRRWGAIPTQISSRIWHHRDCIATFGKTSLKTWRTAHYEIMVGYSQRSGKRIFSVLRKYGALWRKMKARGQMSTWHSRSSKKRESGGWRGIWRGGYKAIRYGYHLPGVGQVGGIFWLAKWRVGVGEGARE